MTILSVFDIGLAVLVLGIGIWAIAAREAFAAIIGFVVYGLLLSIAWVRLSAIDVALTEAAIGGGMTGMLMLGAVARLRFAKGNDTTTSSSVPVTVSGITNATAVQQTCAVLTGGTIQCWGGNAYGELGNGTTTDSTAPVTVPGITNATAAAEPGGSTGVDSGVI